MLKNSCPCCDSRLILDARFDPTGTTTTRVKFEQNLVARFNRLKSLINQSINQNDVFALKALRVGDSASAPAIMMDAEALPARSFTFDRPAEKVQKFMDWLQMAQNGDKTIIIAPRIGQVCAIVNIAIENKIIAAEYATS